MMKKRWAGLRSQRRGFWFSPAHYALLLSNQVEAAAELRELAGEGLAAVGGASPGGGALSDAFRQALPTLLGCLVRGRGYANCGEGVGYLWVFVTPPPR